jgi:hypothetical protein
MKRTLKQLAFTSILVLILVVILILVSGKNALSQAIGYGESAVYNNLGHPDHTAISNDTIIRTYLGGEEIIFFVDHKVVRHVSYINATEARRTERGFRRWNQERNGWYWTGISKCRVIKDGSTRILECRRYDRYNPIPEELAQPPKRSALEILRSYVDVDYELSTEPLDLIPIQIIDMMEEYAAQFVDDPAGIVEKEKETSMKFK